MCLKVRSSTFLTCGSWTVTAEIAEQHRIILSPQMSTNQQGVLPAHLPLTHVPSEQSCHRPAQAPKRDSCVESYSPTRRSQPFSLGASCSLSSMFIKCCLGLCVQVSQRKAVLRGAGSPLLSSCVTSHLQGNGTEELKALTCNFTFGPS